MSQPFKIILQDNYENESTYIEQNTFKVVNNCMPTVKYMNDWYNQNCNYKDVNQTNLIDDVGLNQFLE